MIQADRVVVTDEEIRHEEKKRHNCSQREDKTGEEEWVQIGDIKSVRTSVRCKTFSTFLQAKRSTAA